MLKSFYVIWTKLKSFLFGAYCYSLFSQHNSLYKKGRKANWIICFLIWCVKFFVARHTRHAHPISPSESSYVCQRCFPTPRNFELLCCRRYPRVYWGAQSRHQYETAISCASFDCPSWTKISSATSDQDSELYICHKVHWIQKYLLWKSADIR